MKKLDNETVEILVKYSIEKYDLTRIRAIWRKLKTVCATSHKRLYSDWNIFKNFLVWSLNNKYSRKSYFRIRKDSLSANPNNCVWISDSMKNVGKVVTISSLNKRVGRYKINFENRYIRKEKNNRYSIYIHKNKNNLYYGTYTGIKLARQIRDYCESNYYKLSNKSYKDRHEIIMKEFSIKTNKLCCWNTKRKPKYLTMRNKTYVVRVPYKNNNKQKIAEFSINPNNFKTLNRNKIYSIRDYVVKKIKMTDGYSNTKMHEDVNEIFGN